MYRKLIQAFALAMLGFVLVACTGNNTAKPDAGKPTSAGSSRLAVYNTRAITDWVEDAKAATTSMQTSRLFLSNSRNDLDGNAARFDSVELTPNWGVQTSRLDGDSKVIFTCILMPAASRPSVDEVLQALSYLESAADNTPPQGCHRP